MVIYETGMSEAEFVSILMEMTDGQRGRINVALKPIDRDNNMLCRYIRLLQQAWTENGLLEFTATSPHRLHLTSAYANNCDRRLATRIYNELRGVAAPKHELEVDILDIYKGKLSMFFKPTGSLIELRNTVLSKLNKNGLDAAVVGNYNPHITLGVSHDLPDQDPPRDFETIRFDKIVVELDFQLIGIIE
jgi:2'-5' RNA ligase